MTGNISNTLFGVLDFHLEEVGEQRATISVEITEKHSNGQGDAHGGTLMALADTAMGVACNFLGEKIVTTDLQYRFLREVLPGDRVVAHGEILKLGRSLITTVCHLYVGEKEIGYANASFFRTHREQSDDGECNG